MARLSRNSGFSLVELLTVIAIIAILAAVIFPVMGTVRDRARQSQCMTNLHQVAVAVKMFKTDNRVYPLILGSEVMNDSASIPKKFEQVKDVYLFPEYVKTIQMMHCSSSKFTNSQDVALYDVTSGTTSRPKSLAVYVYDSYDSYVAGAGGVRTGHTLYTESSGSVQRRYNTNWAKDPAWIMNTSNLEPYPPNGSVANDLPTATDDYARQLKFRNPPEDTIVTWCSYHEGLDYNGKSLVIFLDGHADAVSAKEMNACKWRMRPRKV